MIARAGTIAALCIATVAFGAQPAASLDRSTRDFMSRLGLAAGQAVGKPKPPPTPPPAPPASGLLRTKFVEGDFKGKYAPPLAFKTVFSKNIRCPTDDCAIEAIMSIQYTVDASPNDLGICLKVDDRPYWNDCPVLGTMNPLSLYEMSTTTAVERGLSKGRHEVKVEFISNFGASLFDYLVTFNVYAE